MSWSTSDYCSRHSRVDFCPPKLRRHFLQIKGRNVCRLLHDTVTKHQLTVRAVATGLCVGSILCFSNTYFGLQTGWVTMGSLQSAILGFGVFRVLQCWECMKDFSMEENVIVQTTSVATATMPLAAGRLLAASQIAVVTCS